MASFAAFFALPVVRADVVIAHRRGFPLVVGAHRHRDIGAVRLDRVEGGEEFVIGGRHGKAERVEGVLVVDEDVDHRSHGHA